MFRQKSRVQILGRQGSPNGRVLPSRSPFSRPGIAEGGPLSQEAEAAPRRRGVLGGRSRGGGACVLRLGPRSFPHRASLSGKKDAATSRPQRRPRSGHFFGDLWVQAGASSPPPRAPRRRRVELGTARRTAEAALRLCGTVGSSSVDPPPGVAAGHRPVCGVLAGKSWLLTAPAAPRPSRGMSWCSWGLLEVGQTGTSQRLPREGAQGGPCSGPRFPAPQPRPPHLGLRVQHHVGDRRAPCGPSCPPRGDLAPGSWGGAGPACR